MSHADNWHVTTIRTWTCDGCGISATVTEEHPLDGRSSYVTSGTNDADLEAPEGWVVTYRPSHDYHSRECGLAAAAREMYDARPRSSALEVEHG